MAVCALAFKAGNVGQVKGLNLWRLSREFESKVERRDRVPEEARDLVRSRTQGEGLDGDVKEEGERGKKDRTLAAIGLAETRARR